jgi:hypothetical protein
MTPSDSDRAADPAPDALRLRGLLAEQRRLQAALRLRMEDLRAAEEERDSERLIAAGLRNETKRLESRLEQVRRENDAERARIERLLAAVEADVARAVASRAWRLGHGASLLVARATRRGSGGESALDRALSRLEAARRARSS